MTEPVSNTTEDAIKALRSNVASETYILPVAQQKLILDEIERLEEKVAELRRILGECTALLRGSYDAR